METKKINLSIKVFSFDKFNDIPSIIIIGSRGSGKSWIIREILTYFKDIPKSIISPSEKNTFFYDKSIINSYNTYDNVIIENIFADQEIIRKKQNLLENKIDTRKILILDDCLCINNIIKNETFTQLVLNGRSAKIMYILATQYSLGFPPDLRENFDYIFLLGTDLLSEIKRNYEYYGKIFPSFEIFRQIFRQLTEDYGVMIIDNRNRNANFLDSIYWYKVPKQLNI